MVDFHMDEKIEEPGDDYQYCPKGGVPYRECGCDDCSHESTTITVKDVDSDDDDIVMF